MVERRRVHSWLEINEQAALESVLGSSTLLNRNKEMASWVIAADFGLYVENVLPLEESRQTHGKANGVNPDVDPRILLRGGRR